jgi:hypothetical protein
LSTRPIKTTRFQEMELIAEVNVSMIAKGCFSWTVTVKNLETQATRMPPEAPEEGQNSKLSNLLGEKFFRKRITIWSLLVS